MTINRTLLILAYALGIFCLLYFTGRKAVHYILSLVLLIALAKELVRKKQ